MQIFGHVARVLPVLAIPVVLYGVDSQFLGGLVGSLLSQYLVSIWYGVVGVSVCSSVFL